MDKVIKYGTVTNYLHGGIICLLFSILLVFIACDQNRVYEKNINISQNGWPAFEQVVFEVPVYDSAALHNFYINIRHTENYKYSNLYLFIDTYFPEGSHTRDTIEMILADEGGKWYGKGFGKIKEYRVLVRKAIVFPVTGEYKICIEQGMREKNLEGIEDVGIRIERMNLP